MLSTFTFNMRLDFRAAFFFTTLGSPVMIIQYRNFILVLSVLLLCFCGCPSPSGNIGWVDGVVTLDGDPVEGATVRFFPESGRASSGKTDTNGYYELRYTRSEMGAIIGKHKVTVSQEAGLTGDYGKKEEKEEVERTPVPRKYSDRKKTKLSETVESGSNTINLKLTSE